MCLGNDKTVQLLNIHAGVLASNRKKSTRKFSKLFAAFITALEKSGFDETYTEDKDPEVTRIDKNTVVTPENKDAKGTYDDKNREVTQR